VNPLHVKSWETIADSLSKPDGVGAASQPSILAGEQSGSSTRTATTGKRFIVHADEILTAFVEMQRAIHEFAVSLIS
jgi:hypothetical protein